MNLFIKRKNFYLLTFIFSIFAIFFALYIEYILQYKACKLCIYQRIPYIAAIFISLIGLNYLKNDKILILIIIIFLTSAVISGYHYGIENNLIEEFSGCKNDTLGLLNKEKILETFNNVAISCKEVNFKIFGISLAGINLFLSLLIAIYSLRTLVYEKN
tara:strand:- start:326 stop:802 length:477 start_codon:yes stop_codon:yes gene_type:complete